MVKVVPFDAEKHLDQVLALHAKSPLKDILTGTIQSPTVISFVAIKDGKESQSSDGGLADPLPKGNEEVIGYLSAKMLPFIDLLILPEGSPIKRARIAKALQEHFESRLIDSAIKVNSGIPYFTILCSTIGSLRVWVRGLLTRGGFNLIEDLPTGEKVELFYKNLNIPYGE